MVRTSLEVGNSNQELMEKPGRKRWRMWLAAVIVFLLLIVVVVIAVVFLTGPKSQNNGSDSYHVQNPITLEDVMQGNLSPERFNGTWISDTKLLYGDSAGNLVIFDVVSGQSTQLLSANFYVYSASFDQQLSPDHKYLLLSYDYKKLYRHTYSAQYLALDLETNTQHPIIPKINETFLDLAIWGPQGNSIFFVYQNNLFYKKTVDSSPIQLTGDGIPGVIYNAVPDWVYEEEVFGSNKAIWFSNDGSHVAFGKFNDSLTRIMAIPYYGQPGDIDSQYTRALTLKYPKAGTTNPTAGLVLVNLLEPEATIQLPVPTTLDEPILASVSFATNNSVAAVWTNRVQNKSVILLCDISCKKIFEYEEPNGWTDVLRPLIFIADGSGFFSILPKAIGDDSWKQIAFVSRGESENGLWNQRFLTSENNTVTELLHWDQNSLTLWYIATSVEDSAYQHLYSVNLDGKISCFTCKIRHSSDSECLYNEAVMSKDGSHIAISCLGPQVPEIYIYSKDGKKLHDWEKNENVSALIAEKDVPVIRRMSIRVTDAPLPPAQVLLMIPRNADLSGMKKYPLLVNVYAGPDSYQVMEKWNLDWGASLVSRWNIILAMIDGRGSGAKGNNNLFAGYRKLGSVEINDQINVTRKLQYALDYIDPQRTCIWGWSYGGYASTLALAHGGKTFKCAVSVAPVTDWMYYDSIYTERYMGLPTPNDNINGYVSSLLNTQNTAMALRDKNFMLVHGTLDDNVHFQQSMMLSRLLQQNDVLFTQLSYPDEDHGLNGVKHHLYHSIEKFLGSNLLNKT